MRLLLFIFILSSSSVFGNATLSERLSNLSDITFEKISTARSFKECYKILVRQPIDHNDFSKGYFEQKIYLSHKDFLKPVLYYINGYISSTNSISEWSSILDANQIYVEHRYFGESMPEKINWKTLNIENSAADLHRIKLLLKEIYPNSWVSTGTSKGGLTAVSYKYFYPEDVKATIAHSTSVKTIANDTLFFSFIDSLEKRNDCSGKIKEFQRELLTKRKEVIPLLKTHFERSNKTYSRVGLDRIYDIAVLEVSFSIWQNNNGCNAVAFNDTSAEGLFNALRLAIYSWFLTDNIFDEIDAYHYQAVTELGYYGYPTSYFKDLLVEPETIISSVIAPLNVSTLYSNDLMKKIKSWLIHSGNNIIYISGSNDPYSLYKIKPNTTTNSLGLVLNNCNHNQVLYHNLDDKQKTEVVSLLKKWIK